MLICSYTRKRSHRGDIPVSSPTVCLFSLSPLSSFSIVSLCVGAFGQFVLVVLDFQADLANFWSVQCRKQSFHPWWIRQGSWSMPLRVSGTADYLPCFAPVYCPSHNCRCTARHTNTRGRHTKTCCWRTKAPFLSLVFRERLDFKPLGARV